MSAYVYIEDEPSVFTVGFYDPSGKWRPESDHDTREKAASRVHYLNGGNPDVRIISVGSSLPKH